MSEDRERMQREMDSQVDGLGRKAVNVGKNAANRYIKNKVKAKFVKAGSKISGKAIAAGIKALVSAVVTLVQSIIALLAPIILPLLGIMAVAGFLFVAWNEIFYNDRAKNGAFQNDSRKAFAKVYYNDDGSIASIDSSYENDLATLFYSRYAQASYYVTVDDDNRLLQADIVPDDIKDIDNREEMFLLNPQLLSILDQELNENYKIPEQFIKPVYNTCLSKKADGTYEETNGAFCKLKPLTNEFGELIVKSTKYGNVSNSEDYDFNTIYEKTNDKITGIWDWGLAPIIHYKSHTNKSYASDLMINSLQIVKDGKVQTINPADLTDADKTKFGYDTILDDVKNAGNIKRGSKYDKQSQIPADEKVYVIDNVVTFAGDIHNATMVEDVVTGNLSSILTKEYKEWTDTTDNDIIYNKNIYKKVYKSGVYIGQYKSVVAGTQTTKGTPPEELTEEDYEECRILSDPDYVNTGRYDIPGYLQCVEDKKAGLDPGTEDVTVRGVYFDDTFLPGKVTDYTYQYEKKYDLQYVVGGTIYTNTITYTGDTPDTSELNDITYLKDYIDHYATFVEVGKNDIDEYGCYNVKSDKLNSVMKGTYLSSLDTWRTKEFTNAEIARDTSSSAMTLAKKVSNPSECENNQIALRLDGGEMKSFHFGETPDLQILAGAEAMGYDLTTDSENVYAESQSNIKDELLDDVEDKGSSLDTILVLKTSSGETVEALIKKTATKYKLDENLLAAIIMARSDGDINGGSDTYSGCLKTTTGCGPLQIKTDKITVPYHNYIYDKKENILMESVNYNDFEESVNALGALLQYYLETFEGNYFIAVQALDSGEKVMKYILEVAAEEEGYKNIIGGSSWSSYPMDDLRANEWMGYRNYGYLNYKDVDHVGENRRFLEDVLSYISSTQRIQVWDGKSYSSQSWGFMQAKATTQSSAANQFVKIANQRLETGKMRNVWNLLFMNQKGYNAGSYGLYNEDPYHMPQKARYIESFKTGELEQDRIIQLIFAYAEGGSVEEYENLSMADYQARFINMFQIGENIKIDEHYDISLLIPTGEVQKVAKDFYVSRGYGYVYNSDTGIKGYYDDVEISVGRGADVYSIAEGIVQSVQEDADGKYTIAISTSGSRLNKEGVFVDTTTTLFYSNLASANVKRGDSVAMGALIGKTSTDSDSTSDLIYIYGEQDGVTINTQSIVTFIGASYNIGSFDFTNAVFTSEGLLSPIVGTYALTAGCPYYPSGSFHVGVDIAGAGEDYNKTMGMPLVAPADAVVLKTYNGCPSEGYYGSSCGGKCGNHVVLVSEVNGKTFVFYFLHMRQNSITVRPGDFITQGTKFGEIGSSGNSTGPHVHFEIFSMTGMSVQDVVTYYGNTGVTFFLNGKAYHDTTSFCKSDNEKFCRINPEKLYGWKYDGYKTTYTNE